MSQSLYVYYVHYVSSYFFEGDLDFCSFRCCHLCESDYDFFSFCCGLVRSSLCVCVFRPGPSSVFWIVVKDTARWSSIFSILKHKRWTGNLWRRCQTCNDTESVKIFLGEWAWCVPSKNGLYLPASWLRLQLPPQILLEKRAPPLNPWTVYAATHMLGCAVSLSVSRHLCVLYILPKPGLWTCTYINVIPLATARRGTQILCEISHVSICWCELGPVWIVDAIYIIVSKMSFLWEKSLVKEKWKPT